MKCDVCNKRDATICLRQITNTKKVSEIHLCPNCAVEYRCLNEKKENPFQKDENDGDALHSLFFKLSNEIERQKKRKCPACGTKYIDFNPIKKLGCPECYWFFEDEIHESLDYLGFDGKYTGSPVNSMGNLKSIMFERSLLESELELAVQNENYEKAASLRDKIKILEGNEIDGEMNDR